MLRNLGKPLFQMSNRYFAVMVDKGIETQTLYDQGLLIFSAKRENGMFYIFNCKDEIIPYDLIKDSKQYSIEEIELHTQGQSKQLAQLFKYR